MTCPKVYDIYADICDASTRMWRRAARVTPVWFGLWSFHASVFAKTPSASQDEESLASELEQSAFLLHVSQQPSDVYSPWTKVKVQTRQSLGVYVTPQFVITTAEAVRDATLIDIQLIGDSARYRGKVFIIDYEVNLAAVLFDDPRFDKDVKPQLRPLNFAGALAMNATVDILKNRDDDQLIKLRSDFNEASLETAATSLYSHTTYRFDKKSIALGRSEPIVRGHSLVGIVTGQDENSIYATPSFIIKHFVDDILENVLDRSRRSQGEEVLVNENAYRGFPSLGIEVKPLVDPNVRLSLGAQNVKGGLRVARVSPNSRFKDKLAVDDVITHIAGQEISSLGLIKHPDWGRVHFRYAINQLFGGDKVELKVLRKGQAMAVQGETIRFDSNAYQFPHHRYDREEPYVIFGGLVIQELSRPYLQLWGREWYDTAPIHLLHLYNDENKIPEVPGTRKIVISRVLSDEFNRGYDDADGSIIEKVNGEEIINLKSLTEALKKPIYKNGKAFAVFTLGHNMGEVILNYESLASVHKRIANNYNIPTDDAGFFAAGSIR